MATFFNQASLSYNGNVTQSNITVGEIVGVLTASKDALTTVYASGDKVTYVIALVNSGATALSSLTVSDNLGAYPFGTLTLRPLDYVDGSLRYYVNGVLQASPTVTANDELVISGISIPPSSNALLVYETTVNSFAPLDAQSQITNVATIGGDGVNDVTVSETINASDASSLTVTKAVNPTVVSENGRITYTFVIQNYGNTAASVADNAVLSDTFNPVLSDITVSYNGNAWVEGVNYTYNASSGEFRTVDGQITVDAASYVQDPTTGEWSVVPSSAVITVSGNI